MISYVRLLPRVNFYVFLGQVRYYQVLSCPTGAKHRERGISVAIFSSKFGISELNKLLEWKPLMFLCMSLFPLLIWTISRHDQHSIYDLWLSICIICLYVLFLDSRKPTMLLRLVCIQKGKLFLLAELLYDKRHTDCRNSNLAHINNWG